MTQQETILEIEVLHPDGLELMGLIPGFLDPGDEAGAREQLDRNYRHGGGWSPMARWSWNNQTHQLSYPGDSPMGPVGVIRLRQERVYVYPGAWVVIVQPEGEVRYSWLA